ncbi:porin [Rhodovarius crocodyli]|uniref:Porin n=1 Tax=Rhodovarius crocodyli TaxID=1979269 RepID=A0A437MMI6_9PROT|nr:porin [Rhodovarius crocodyli]RVT98851.1 porin [Rhodovarius crocodyli]
MRKILLGTTAVVSAAFGAAVVTPAAAQEAPTVRLGGSIQAYYGYHNSTGQQNDPGTNTLSPGVQGGGANPVAAGNSIARLGKHDIVTIPAINIQVNGKLANGLTYGGVIEIGFNSMEGRQVQETRASVGRGTAAVDEAYIFLAHPRFGQVRFGDEDGPMGGLMTSGWVTGFGTGGVFGVWENFQNRQAGNRTQTAPGGIGDSSKIVYLSPQFFGFDFGASYAPNYGVMGQTGCPNNVISGYCDRAYAFRGATSVAIPAAGPEFAARRNEYQVALRYRGSFSGVGVSATAGYIGSGAALDMTDAGRQVRTLNDLNIWQIGAQASYQGLTVGAAYQRGDFNFFWGNTVRGDRSGEQLTVGAAYTAGPITVGANMYSALVAGSTGRSFSATTGLITNSPRGMQRRWGMGLGANYRLAPGLDLIAEYVFHSIRQQNVDLDSGRAGVQGRAFSNTFIVGSRLAF